MDNEYPFNSDPRFKSLIENQMRLTAPAREALKKYYAATVDTRAIMKAAEDMYRPYINNAEAIQKNIESIKEALNSSVPPIKTKLAEELNPNVADDFETTLNSLMENVDSLKNKSLPEESKAEVLKSIELISEKIKSSSNVTNDELDTVHQESNRKEDQGSQTSYESNNPFDVFVHKIRSSLVDPNWHAEQLINVIGNAFYELLMTMVVKVISGELDTVFFLLLIKALLSLFPFDKFK